MMRLIVELERLERLVGRLREERTHTYVRRARTTSQKTRKLTILLKCGRWNDGGRTASCGKYSKRVDGSASVGGGTYDDRRLIRGMPVGDGGHEGMKTVGSWMVWNAGGGVGAEHARRP